jgi:hypothetical protein
MGDIGVIVMRVLVTPSGIDFESEIAVGIGMNGPNPE